MKQMIEVWGLAAGRNSTKEAARGAFTWRRYEPGNVRKEDWLLIMSTRAVMVYETTENEKSVRR
ncbi:MAG: hypothetical protein NT140_05705 [Deltaproteobacteria bacterium]|nr:hypothetical protein [Deltaproteobacteria bacterium]